ncbi:glycoside hydrolase family 32 protein [Halalkalibacter sp. APA_J-10(15)]|uniref:glycoside hydrolase family 32 protein n=1 Tax=Halalkalibacter sp. APA_J-10(15) TaxID=2933805 RepID=UPI001FF517FA|nr:glycoside hydrolase family 32 protein [Halalkalibacter sp. APA_J-10(15)]MCK0473269.1 glycoside hydrolase family 32 protein [Halalkalibacter sp. APA_J-10(15)]
MTIQNIDKYRPNLHFAPQRNWMNDPNGLIYFNGEYHLFYQYNPNDSVWGPMHWGHAVSKDLITWEELDIALYPDEKGTIFSGSAVIDWNNTSGFFPEEPGMVAIFTHHNEFEGEAQKQTQSIAYSYDQGRTWEKFEENPVLEHETKLDFRDPKVFWHHETSKWIMVLATGQTISIYSSTNLKEWKFQSEFGQNMGFHDGVWECPDLFQLKVEGSNEKKWVLFVSVGDNEQFDVGSCTQYFIGSFDGSHFEAEHDDTRWLDYGKDNYAGVSFSDIPEEDGRRIYLGWMSNWRYANQVPTVGWRSQMTLPRELTLRNSRAGKRVVQKLVRELGSYFAKKHAIEQLIVNEREMFPVNEQYVQLDLHIENIDANQFGITLHHTDNQYTTLTIDSINNTFELDRKNSGEISFSDNFLKNQIATITNTDHLQIRFVQDTSSVEVFLNDGEYVLTSLLYPDNVCEQISFFSKGGSIKLIDGYISGPKRF